jgi:HK97 family phage portal protein
MGLGKMLRPARPQPQEDRLAGSTFQIAIDGTPGGVSGTSEIQHYRGGMSIPGAWRGSLLIADMIGQLPWDLFLGEDEDETAVKVWPRPPLLHQPAPPDTRMTTFSSSALDLVWHGNAVGVVAARDAFGTPTAVLPVPASWVGVRRVTERDYPLPRGEVEYWIGGITFPASDVIHIKGPCAPGSLRGFGVLEAHMDGVLDLAAEQISQARSVSQHGVPTGVLKSLDPNIDQAGADALKTAWLRSQRQRSIAVLNSTTEFQALSWNPEQLELVDARKFTLHEIALIFGLPLSFLGADQSTRTYSNVEEEDIQLLKFTLSGHLARFEQTLSLAFPPGHVVRANLEMFLRSDTLNRYRAYQLGVSSGWLRRSEVRKRENLAVVAGIDEQPASPVQPPDGGAGPEKDAAVKPPDTKEQP